VEEAHPIDDLVETTGLNSSEVLATLFTLEMKGIVRQLPAGSSRKCCWERLQCELVKYLLERRELAPALDEKCTLEGLPSIWRMRER
jgi:hypothetical protein